MDDPQMDYMSIVAFALLMQVFTRQMSLKRLWGKWRNLGSLVAASKYNLWDFLSTLSALSVWTFCLVAFANGSLPTVRLAAILLVTSIISGLWIKFTD